MPRYQPTGTVKLSHHVFTVWWLLLLAVHAVTCLYNLIYAHYYWILQDAYLNVILESLGIGMPSSAYHTISVVHGVLSAMHAVCISLMLCGTVRQRSLVFTPWGSRTIEATREERLRPDRTRALERFAKVYDKVSTPSGFFGVGGKYFHEIQLFREVVEISLQTVQAYRMSFLLPRTLLNRFFVVLLAINCWSSAIVNRFFPRKDEARRRFACIVVGFALDLMACLGVPVIIVLSYTGHFDRNLEVTSYLVLYDDESMARAYNEFQLLVVVSWWDLASRATFALGLLVAATNMKELLERLPRNTNRVAESIVVIAVARKGGATKWTAESHHPSMKNIPLTHRGGTSLRTRVGRVLVHSIHFLLVAWGAVVLGFHIHASMQPLLSQCLMQVRPWAASRPSCYLVGLDCYSLGISGKIDEVDAMWSEFDGSTVVQLLIRHCPALETPSRFSEFHNLRGIKVYNTTIVDWSASAAITNANHPEISMLYVVRVNMTDGLLPAAFQSSDFPRTLHDIEFCVTNLRELPDDLDGKWLAESFLVLEYGQLTEVPLVLVRLEPMSLALTGNPISQLPPELFEVDSMYLLGIGNMNIYELPSNVTHLSENLYWVTVYNTDISFFWLWADKLVGRMASESAPWIAGSSTYCNDLVKVLDGAADGFQVPLSPEYSQTLMDSSEENLLVISAAVNCGVDTELASGGAMFYPLGYEDSLNAIGTAPALVQRVG
ncbi:Centrosomal protein of 41 kDa [Phytophthora pseudosyringae]|uniref:Centrosomal protein of 41 kDa n=1 Tax=Phytophthora pseudosyringae TaxID=221518 RepID=A0A8T1VC82_9STRA|nr:Centrosomal protein of 41 kDa [Phytophthora pseudosyringae]